MDKQKKTIQILLLFVLAGLIGYAIWSSSDSSPNGQNMTAKEFIASQALPEKSKAPEFQLPGITQDTIRFVRSDKPAIINFWATWCENCKRDMPLLEKVYKEKGDQVRIIMVHTTHMDQKETALQYINRHGFTFPVGLDLDGHVSDLYRVKALPQTFFIDQNGRIVHHQIGELTQSVLDQHLPSLLDP